MTEPDPPPIEKVPREKPPWTPLRVLVWGVAGFVGVTLLNLFLLDFLDHRSRSRYHRRSEALGDLKQQALAATNYYTVHGVLPPHGTGEPGGPPVAWMTAMLPYMDERAVHESIDFAQPYTAPENAAAFGTEIRTLRSPHRRDHVRPDGLGAAHYAGNRPLFAPAGRLDAIPDGVTYTLLIGEVNVAAGGSAAWGDPANLRSAAAAINTPVGFGGNGRGGNGRGGNGRGGFVIVLADGRAEFINETIDPAVLAALGTPDGGEALDEF